MAQTCVVLVSECRSCGEPAIKAIKWTTKAGLKRRWPMCETHYELFMRYKVVRAEYEKKDTESEY